MRIHIINIFIKYKININLKKNNKEDIHSL